ncbi:hypothetical protein V8F06_001994 [Rhypophila decipiens]
MSSVQVTADERRLLVEMFCAVVTEALPHNNGSLAQFTAEGTARTRAQIELSVRSFAKKMLEKANITKEVKQTQRRSSAELHGPPQYERPTSPPAIATRSHSHTEREDAMQPISPGSWAGSESDGGSDVDHPALIQGISPTEILDRYKAEPAFQSMVSEIDLAVNLYRSDKLVAISRQVGRSVRRHYPELPSREAQSLTAIFNVDWNLGDYLCSNYDDVCTVAQYFKQTWPTHPQALLRAVRDGLDRQSQARQEAYVPAWLANDFVTERILVDLNSNKVLVRGSEPFLITVSQQIAWLAAACSMKQEGVRYALAEVIESTVPDLEPTRAPNSKLWFDVIVQLKRPPPPSPGSNDEPAVGSCWNSILGPAVVVVGYPIAKRDNGERGLEIHPYQMANFIDISEAVTFAGGYVIKGMFHAFVPVLRSGKGPNAEPESLQWHVISSTYPTPLEWDDIVKQCPTRELEQDPEALWNARSYFGWTSSAISYLGTKNCTFSLTRGSTADLRSKLDAPGLTLRSLADISFNLNDRQKTIRRTIKGNADKVVRGTGRLASPMQKEEAEIGEVDILYKQDVVRIYRDLDAMHANMHSTNAFRKA